MMTMTVWTPRQKALPVLEPMMWKVFTCLMYLISEALSAETIIHGSRNRPIDLRSTSRYDDDDQMYSSLQDGTNARSLFRRRLDISIAISKEADLQTPQIGQVHVPFSGLGKARAKSTEERNKSPRLLWKALNDKGASLRFTIKDRQEQQRIDRPESGESTVSFADFMGKERVKNQLHKLGNDQRKDGHAKKGTGAPLKDQSIGSWRRSSDHLYLLRFLFRPSLNTGHVLDGSLTQSLSFSGSRNGGPTEVFVKGENELPFMTFIPEDSENALNSNCGTGCSLEDRTTSQSTRTPIKATSSLYEKRIDSAKNSISTRTRVKRFAENDTTGNSDTLFVSGTSTLNVSVAREETLPVPTPAHNDIMHTPAASTTDASSPVLEDGKSAKVTDSITLASEGPFSQSPNEDLPSDALQLSNISSLPSTSEASAVVIQAPDINSNTTDNPINSNTTDNLTLHVYLANPEMTSDKDPDLTEQFTSKSDSPISSVASTVEGIGVPRSNTSNSMAQDVVILTDLTTTATSPVHLSRQADEAKMISSSSHNSTSATSIPATTTNTNQENTSANSTSMHVQDLKAELSQDNVEVTTAITPATSNWTLADMEEETSEAASPSENVVTVVIPAQQESIVNITVSTAEGLTTNSAHLTESDTDVVTPHRVQQGPEAKVKVAELGNSSRTTAPPEANLTLTFSISIQSDGSSTESTAPLPSNSFLEPDAYTQISSEPDLTSSTKPTVPSELSPISFSESTNRESSTDSHDDAGSVTWSHVMSLDVTTDYSLGGDEHQVLHTTTMKNDKQTDIDSAQETTATTTSGSKVKTSPREGGSGSSEKLEGNGVKDQEVGRKETVEPASEPIPDWKEAKVLWRRAWDVHLYAFGCLFALLGLCVLLSVFRMWSLQRLLSRRYFLSLNAILLLLCATRAVYLLMDGYNSNSTFNPGMDYALYFVSFPCLTSAFSIQLYVLLQATNFQLLPPVLQKISVLASIIVFHFAIFIATSIVVGTHTDIDVMQFFCQLFYMLWGLVLFCSYIAVFRRLVQQAVKRQDNATSEPGIKHYNGGTKVKAKSKFTLSLAVKVTLSTAIFGLLTVGLEVYAVVDIYRTFSDSKPMAWPWWLYHTALRLLEFLMAATMSYVAAQPFRYRPHGTCRRCCSHVLWAPCSEVCCCGGGGGASVNRSSDLAGWSEFDHYQMTPSLGQDSEHFVIPNGGAHGFFQKNGDDKVLTNPKTRIYFNDNTDVVPIIMSQPVCMTAEAGNGYSLNADVNYSFGGDGDYQSPSRSRGSPEEMSSFSPPLQQQPTNSSTPVATRDGMVNTAYAGVTDDFQSPCLSGGSRSRKSSLASSEFFHAPSSLSLAGSMASELEKAFRSMRDDPEFDLCDARSQRSGSAHSSLREQEENYPYSRDENSGPEPLLPGESTDSTENSVRRYLQQQTDGSESPVIRRSCSAVGRSSFHEDEPLNHEPEVENASPLLDSESSWQSKLFRCRSDNVGGIRTKDVDNATYLSLLDIEKQEQDDSEREYSKNSLDGRPHDSYVTHSPAQASNKPKLNRNNSGQGFDSDGSVSTFDTSNSSQWTNHSVRPLLRYSYDDYDDVEV